MPHVSRTDILQDYRTRSLLESTRRIIAAHGFDAVTMERVAEAAGIAKGGIYLYFRNKNELILSAIEEIASEMVGEIESRVDATAGPWERLCQLVRGQLEIMEEHKDLLRTLLLDRRLLLDHAAGRRWRRLLRYRERHEGHIREILEEGIRLRVFQPVDTTHVAFYINEITISTAQRRMLGLVRSSASAEAASVIRFLVLLRRDRQSPGGKD